MSKYPLVRKRADGMGTRYVDVVTGEDVAIEVHGLNWNYYMIRDEGNVETMDIAIGIMNKY